MSSSKFELPTPSPECNGPWWMSLPNSWFQLNGNDKNQHCACSKNVHFHLSHKQSCWWPFIFRAHLHLGMQSTGPCSGAWWQLHWSFFFSWKGLNFEFREGGSLHFCLAPNFSSNLEMSCELSLWFSLLDILFHGLLVPISSFVHSCVCECVCVCVCVVFFYFLRQHHEPSDCWGMWGNKAPLISATNSHKLWAPQQADL